MRTFHNLTIDAGKNPNNTGILKFVVGVREIAFNGPTYNVKVRERRGEEVREARLKLGKHGWIGWALFSGW